jgi:hypothetical protein
MNARIVRFHCNSLPEGVHCFKDAVAVSYEEVATSILFANTFETINSPISRVKVNADFLN